MVMVAESRDTTLRIAIVQLFIAIHRQIGQAEFDRLIRPQLSEKDAQFFDERFKKAPPAAATSVGAGGLSQSAGGGGQPQATNPNSAQTPGSFSTNTFVKRPSTAGPAPTAPAAQSQVGPDQQPQQQQQQQQRPQTTGHGRPSFAIPPKGLPQQQQAAPAEQPVDAGYRLQFPEEDLDGMRSASELMPLEPVALTDEVTVARVERPEVLESLGYAQSALSNAEDSELGVPPPAQLNVVLAAIASHDANEATSALLSLDELLHSDGKPGISVT